MPTSDINSGQSPTPDVSLAKRKIAALTDEIEILKQDKAIKQRKTTYYISQGRAIRRIVALYTPIEDLITENDRRQDRLQRGYIELAKALLWLHNKLACLDHEESEDMLRKLKRGADSARGDDTGTLKELVASWVNIECHPTTLIRTSAAVVRFGPVQRVLDENQEPDHRFGSAKCPNPEPDHREPFSMVRFSFFGVRTRTEPKKQKTVRARKKH
ncbi:uncharacterized protein HD556DRAFT_1313989 [Suillus plorans]|uniref:Uncharacterized protein n=1 Tax=Suillus plorans TaxID=116603 RepID=A0A9P7DB85_9AGAM|nr:uncharacterized protein HD556DRAFT_1313989 [Suillus plorans]KAG1785822.1 hypothetical protein HD556DRAFT_1313989 [Suillus plorans]